MIRSIVSLLAVMSIVVLSACAIRDGGPAEPYATVMINNDSPLQVTVHAVRNGSRVRVGTVPGVTVQSFPIRTDMLGAGNQLRMVIDPVGSRLTYPSTPISVSRGDTIELRVSSLIR